VFSLLLAKPDLVGSGWQRLNASEQVAGMAAGGFALALVEARCQRVHTSAHTVIASACKSELLNLCRRSVPGASCRLCTRVLESQARGRGTTSLDDVGVGRIVSQATSPATFALSGACPAGRSYLTQGH